MWDINLQRHTPFQDQMELSVQAGRSQRRKRSGCNFDNDLQPRRQCREAARKAMNVLRTTKRYFKDWTKQPF